MSVREQLTRLVQLQVTELALRRVESELGAIPADRAAAQEKVDAARAGVAAAEAELEANRKSLRQHEGELQEAETDRDRYREHELRVKTNEQLWALQGEMRQALGVIDAVEETILEEMESADALGVAIQQCQRDLGQAETEVEVTLRDLAAKQVRLEQERVQASDRIGALETEVDEELLAKYRRLSTRAGVALAEALDGTCLGCHVRLRPQLYLEVLSLEAPVHCDSCKRILYSREALKLPSSVQSIVD